MTKVPLDKTTRLGQAGHTEVWKNRNQDSGNQQNTDTVARLQDIACESVKDHKLTIAVGLPELIFSAEDMIKLESACIR